MSTQSAPDVKIPVPRGPLPILPVARPARMVEIMIDGKSVSVAEGSTLLEAARSMGIDTPTLCFLENLTPVNVCRICVVEVEGSRALVPACSRQVEPGMVDQNRFGEGATEPAAGAGVACVIRGCLHRAPVSRIHAALWRQAGALRGRHASGGSR